MKNIKIVVFTAGLILVFALTACSSGNTPVDTAVPSGKPEGQIYLYGERHGVTGILEKELELWGEYYQKENMRHLFVEYANYTAELLNLWMQSDNDDILEAIYEDWEGTQAYTQEVKEFYKTIKREYPETVFHGTDIGHQQKSGLKFLEYLMENNLEDSEQYLLTQEVMKQGRYYYKHIDTPYRENKMAENFIREFEKLEGESIMGIYGAAHTDFNGMDFDTESVPCMARQLKERYGDNIHSENLAWAAKEDIEPLNRGSITVNQKEYKASYFGQQDLISDVYDVREFWRLENAYDDFRDSKKTGDVLPYEEYPMPIAEGQIFVVKYIKPDGFADSLYYRSEGYIWQGLRSTEGFVVE